MKIPIKINLQSLNAAKVGWTYYICIIITNRPATNNPMNTDNATCISIIRHFNVVKIILYFFTKDFILVLIECC